MASETGIVKQEAAPIQRVQSVRQLVEDEAKILHAGGMFPQHKSVAAITTICLKARELGIGPVWALEKFYLTSKGKVGTYSDLMLALALQRGITFEIHQCDAEGCEILFERWDNPHRQPMTFLSRFTKADAVRAGLMGKDTYKAYPTDLLKAKTIFRGLNTLCPDYLAGLSELTSLGAMMAPVDGRLEPIVDPDTGFLVLEPEIVEQEEAQEANFDLPDDVPAETITEAEWEDFRARGMAFCEGRGLDVLLLNKATAQTMAETFPGLTRKTLTMEQLTVLEDMLSSFDYDSLAEGGEG